MKKLMQIKWLRLICLLILLPIILTAFAGCAGNAAAVKAALGEAFAVGIGQTAEISGEDMKITFKEMVGDSRCPTGVTCIWAGVASASVTIVYKGTTYSLALNQPGHTSPVKETFFDYTFSFDISPYPAANQEIAKKDYRLNMTVSK